MVGIMASATPRERLAGLIDSIKVAPDISSKLHHLRYLSDELLQDDPVLLAEFLPLLLDLTSDRFSPVRKFIIQMAGEIGMKQTEFLPEIVPVLISFLNDESPPVARQAIACGLDLFRCTFQKIAIQGLFSSELDDSLESSWGWMLNFKDKLYAKAFKPVHKPGRDGIKLLALKFVEAIILLFTPDPSGSSEPPPHQTFVGNLNGFNISWLRSGHPVLNVGDLSIEASQRLGLLLDQLRFPTVKSLSSLTIIVLIHSLSAVAKKRPAFYGRILPVLLGLDPTSYVTNDSYIYGASHALKNAFISCLESTHPGAAPWRDRLLLALKEIQDGKLVKKLEDHDYKMNENEPRVDDSPEEKVTVQGIDLSSKVRKRTEAEDSIDHTSENEGSGKRVKPSPSISEESTDDLRKKSTIFQDENALSRPSPPKADGSSAHVLQLVALFGTLVAQGDTAAASLDILISSISPDLLAELVMANMRQFPMQRPKAEEEGAEEEVFSLSSAFPQIASILDVQQPVSNTDLKSQEEEEAELVVAPDDSSIGESDKIDEDESSVLPTVLPVTDAKDLEEIPSDALTSLHGTANVEIPGLTSIINANVSSEPMSISSLALTDVETNQEQDTRLAEKPSLDVLPSISNDRSVELSAKTMSVDESIQIASTATSLGLTSYFVLPKISAPVVNLPDEQRDQLQQFAFSRIIEAYKDAEAAGLSETRFALLSHIGVEFPSELDPWKLLQQHIVSDYVNHEGHELTLRLLYRLFGESEVESDFFYSTTASSAYEMLLLSVAETLKDSFPASDKSLSRLLGEVPHLPPSVLKLLELLCSPSNTGTPEESQSGDRVTQGLSAVWSLILQRPPVRGACLKIALQSTIHHLEEVRMKAIRLVANKLYPLPFISQQIEEFATNMLFSVSVDASDKMDSEKSVTESTKVLQDSSVEKVSCEHMTKDITTKEIPSDTRLPSSEEIPSNSLAEAQRCMSLYFALCTKKHFLFRHIFVIYERVSKAAKEAIHRHIPILVRTMGASSAFLEIISDAPIGSVNLLTQVLRTLTDGSAPPPELIRAIRKLYDSKLKDVEILMPILPFLQKEEVSSIFPHLLNLPSDKFQAALVRILKGSSHAGPTLSPEECLIAIHGIDPERDGIPLKKITDACNACFEQKDLFTQQILAKVLNQLVEQTPLPLLFMRTVLQSIGAFPGLVSFIIDNILSRLIKQQIWKYPKLWVGFLKCAILTKPQSFDILLQLPAAQLENALNRIAASIKEPLIAHASQPHVRSTVPRGILVVLGIISDAQAASGQAQSISHTPQTQASPSEPVSQAQSTQASQAESVSQTQSTQASQAESLSQMQTQVSPGQTSSQTQTQASQSQTTVDTGTSDKEAVVAPEKESSSSIGG